VKNPTAPPLVIDTKAHVGRVELIDRGSFCRPSLRLHVAGCDRRDLVRDVQRRADLVRGVFGGAGLGRWQGKRADFGLRQGHWAQATLMVGFSRLGHCFGWC